MASTDKIIIAFDLYGTLLSTESIAKELATHFGNDKAQSIAALWRRYQLEYTWRMNSMCECEDALQGHTTDRNPALYRPFSEITNASLKHALAEHSVSLSEDAIESLMKAYDSLDTFPEVESGLKSIASDPKIEAYVFSNGTDAMVASSVKQSPSLSQHAHIFRNLITVEEIGVFKPDRRVYEHLARRVGQEMGRVWLVSGNPFDVVGAKVAGIQAAWVNRAGGHRGSDGWNDQLGELCGGVKPTVVVKGVDEAVEAIRKWASEHQ
ncbi:hypothetical protein BP5796_06187 [Coleophoma crateriformis]|uniref:Haloacid dehalogenase n=1 Tax=Coleophoma crateriformis TaxID=565419 RepID=A0A3D8RWE1_9HELO|nr:hypothetical protein BP5796_06187 [Coleophoma crateriformis]